MNTSLFDYELPEELIAQEPVEPRDSSRLMVLFRRDGRIEHHRFSELPAYLRQPDLLVVNNTRVIPARLIGKVSGGGSVELLLIKRMEAEDSSRWEALARPGRRVRPGRQLYFGDGKLTATVLEDAGEGRRLVEFHSREPVEDLLRTLGVVPLPPYIRRPAPMERYQTVYSRYEGSVAAPTAGLHFTPELLGTIRRQGVDLAEVVLHVGPGTFRPVRSDTVEDHRMDAEYYRVPPEAAERLRACRSAGGRVVAVGTTVVRTLETMASKHDGIAADEGWADLFIYPGFSFRLADAMVTNFHLPRSTLLMLVCAFAGRDLVLRAYRIAVEEGYRFYSFGDAMLIL